MFRNIHPTKQTLIMTAVGLLEANPTAEITSEQILEISGISKGSLYHHFEDFSEMMEYAHVFIFTREVDKSIAEMNMMLLQSKTREDLVGFLSKVTRRSQSPDMKSLRNFRLVTVAKTVTNLRLRKFLAEEQLRLTGALADLYREAQERGWANPALNPTTVAIFVEAYTMGKVVDEIATTHMDPEDWYSIVDQTIEKILFPAVK
ncbi:MAG: TetR/AcrR family transcriptional regulator [Actinomycetes bacterium]